MFYQLHQNIKLTSGSDMGKVSWSFFPLLFIFKTIETPDLIVVFIFPDFYDVMRRKK